jgi:outer membrane protein OmpA-like peptidoglycan-associated protein
MQKVTPSPASRLGVAGFAAVLALAVAGCTLVDSGVSDVPGAERPFPNLATVPDRPTGFEAPAQRQASQDQLAFDRAAAAPLGSTPAATAEAPQPAAAVATPAEPLPPSGLDERDIAGGGWLNEELPQKPSRALAGLVFFDNGSSKLKPKARDVLRAVAALQREHGGVLRLVGHASSTLSSALEPAEGVEINRRVAQRRAASTAAELRRLGLAPDQIQIGAEGAEAPAFDEATPLGEAGNRRVEIYLEL